MAVERIARDLGQHLFPSPMRLTEFAPASESIAVAASHPAEYGPPQWARQSFTKGFAGADFVPQPDGSFSAQPPCLPQVTSSPFQGSPPAEPFASHFAVHPALWGDWPRCQPRRRWMRLSCTQTVELAFRTLPLKEDLPPNRQDVQTRALRAHYRLSWQQRLARNARPSSAPVLTITLHGLPAAFARYVGIEQVTAA